MKHCLTSAEARDRADDAARAAHEALRAPGVRLTLTVGVIFCMLATVAALTIPEAAAFVVTLLSGGDGLPAWVTPVSGAVLLFTVSPMYAGFLRMCAGAADEKRTDIRTLFVPYSSVRGLVSAWCAFAALALRFALPTAAVIVFDRSEELRPWTWAAAVAAAVLMYCMNFMSVFAVRAAVDPQRMTARGFAEALRQSMRCRRAYDRAAVREIPLLLLSLATVGVLFLFHTLPLWGTERYLLDLSPDYTTK